MGYRTAELPPVDLDEFATIPFLPRMKILMLHWVEEGFGTPKQTATFYAWKIFFYGLFGLIVAAKIFICVIWMGAGFSKLQHGFSSTVSIMSSAAIQTIVANQATPASASSTTVEDAGVRRFSAPMVAVIESGGPTEWSSETAPRLSREFDAEQ